MTKFMCNSDNVVLVSILVPVYNGEKSILQCLESIKKQSYQNIEVIVIDDGSSDTSLVKCQKFIKGDSRFRIYSKENGGVSSARNLALSIASGHYIAFVDCDDIIHSKFIENLIKISMSENVDICISNFKRISISDFFEKHDQLREKESNIRIDNDYEVLSPERTLEIMIMENNFKWEVCGKLFTSEIAKKIFFDEAEVLFEDFSYICKALAMSEKIVYVPLKMYYYVDNPFSASKQKYSDKLSHLIHTTENFDIYIAKFFPNLNYCAKYFKAIVYFDILDKIILSSTSFLDLFKFYMHDKNNNIYYYDLLVKLRCEVMKFKLVPRRFKFKYLFTFKRSFYFFSRFFFNKVKFINLKK